MKTINLTILFIISIVEFYFFVISLILGTISPVPFLIIHLVLVFIYYLINSKFIESKSDEKPMFLTIFLPGIGFFIVFTIELVTQISKPKTEEIKMVTIFEILDETSEYNFLSEDKVLSYKDNMKYLSNDDQVSLLFDVLEDGTYDKLKILKQGAENENQVVKYYSSVYLSSLVNQFENELFRLSDKFIKTNNLIDLKNLITIYDSYLTSGLLKDDMYDFFNEKYISYLKKAVQADIEVLKNSIRLIKAYLNSKQFEKVIKLIEETKKTYSDSLEIRLLEINYYDTTNNIELIETCIKDIFETISEIPPKEMSILKFWSESVA